jgi:glycosyltransferase involved in cell wall biosynthesis
MLVSLVLATVGRNDEVGRCLYSLHAQTDQNFEVLLVDQNQDDRLVPWVNELRAKGLSLQHLRMDKPSLSGARNLGIEKAHGAIIGFPDDDCWYEPDVVANVRVAFASAPQLAGVVGNWVEQSAAQGLASSTATLSYEAWRRFKGGDGSSISLFFRITLFHQLQGFDERLGVGRWYGSGEEFDFILRALAAGAVIQRLPVVRVHHLYGVPATTDLANRSRSVRMRARGVGAIYAKHRINALIVLRGLVAPMVTPFIQARGWPSLVIGFWNSVGRFEGMHRWGRGKE